MHPDDEEELIKKVKRIEEENSTLRNDQADFLMRITDLEQKNYDLQDQNNLLCDENNRLLDYKWMYEELNE
jgi:hypothetical protein